MDDNTLEAIGKLCQLAKDSTTVSGELQIIGILGKLMDKINPNTPQEPA